jgi:hypothetical protein
MQCPITTEIECFGSSPLRGNPEEEVSRTSPNDTERR